MLLVVCLGYLVACCFVYLLYVCLLVFEFLFFGVICGVCFGLRVFELGYG